MWDLAIDPCQNPLYKATENVEAELLKCPDHLTNETQIAPLTNFSTTPFFVLKRLNRKRSPPSTPSSIGSTSSNETDKEESSPMSVSSRSSRSSSISSNSSKSLTSKKSKSQ